MCVCSGTAVSGIDCPSPSPREIRRKLLFCKQHCGPYDDGPFSYVTVLLRDIGRYRKMLHKLSQWSPLIVRPAEVSRRTRPVGATSWLRCLSVPRPMLGACCYPCSSILCVADYPSTQMSTAVCCFKLEQEFC